MVSLCRKIEDSPLFQNFVIGVIVFAGLLVGLETDSQLVQAYGPILGFLDSLVLTIFSVEILIKLVARSPQPWHFFRDPWNVFDFVIVAACFVPLASQYAMVLRMLRLLRVLRLVRAVPRLQVVVEALLRGLPSMFYVSLLLMMLFYMYAVMGTFLFATNDPVHFGNLQTSFLSLFRIVTLEDWTDIMYTQIYGCDVYGYGFREHLCLSPQSFPLVGPLYFVSFVLFGTMIFLNLFIGVIVNGMDEARKEQEAKLRQRILAAQEPLLSWEQEVAQLESLIQQSQKHLERLKTKGGFPRGTEAEEGNLKAPPGRAASHRRPREGEAGPVWGPGN